MCQGAQSQGGVQESLPDLPYLEAYFAGLALYGSRLPNLVHCDLPYLDGSSFLGLLNPIMSMPHLEVTCLF